MGRPASLSFIFDLFKQTSLQLLQQIYVKNVHPVYGARIRTTTFRTWVSFITTRPISFRFMSPNKFIHFKYPKKSSTRVLVYLFRPLFVYFVLFTFQLHWWTYNFNYKNEKSVDGIRTLDRIINIPMRWQFHWAEAANQMSRFFNPEIKLQICRLVFAFSCLAYCTTSQYSVKAVVGNKQFNIFAPIWGCFLEKRRNKKESDNWIWHVFPTARFSNAKIFSLFYCGKSSTSHREGVKKIRKFYIFEVAELSRASRISQPVEKNTDLTIQNSSKSQISLNHEPSLIDCRFTHGSIRKEG